MNRLSVFAAVAWTMAAASSSAEQLAEFERFGTVHLYSTSAQPTHVVLFVSGDGGWNQGVVDMAANLAGMDALVAGIDITHYLRELEASPEKCSYPAADFEALSQFLQHKNGYAHYVKPVLVGYSSGATLVYALLAQAPPTTFKGAISLGFCPDLPLTREFCKGSGLEQGPGPRGKGISFRPARELAVPWIALQGTIDQVCDPASTEKFVKQVPGATLVMLPKVGHGYSVPKNWLPQFRDAFTRVVTAPDATEPAPVQVASLADLPLVELGAPGAGATSFAVLWTGDGGYGVTDKGIATELAQNGIPVVVLNSLHYFWKPKTPEETASDLGRILQHYHALWNSSRAIVIGYSHGADVLPFAVNGLAPDSRAIVAELVLLGIGPFADFDFHVGDWLHEGRRATSRPVLPELEKLRGLRMICFYGTDDKETLGPTLDPTLVESIPIATGHRFGSDYRPIVERILAETRR
jgi:type IV secretory pathway VirJ component